jgi:hypothetical protein
VSAGTGVQTTGLQRDAGEQDRRERGSDEGDSAVPPATQLWAVVSALCLVFLVYKVEEITMFASQGCGRIKSYNFKALRAVQARGQCCVCYISKVWRYSLIPPCLPRNQTDPLTTIGKLP